MHMTRKQNYTKIPSYGFFLGKHIDRIDNIKQVYAIKLGIFFRFLL